MGPVPGPKNSSWDPDGEIENSWKSIFEIRNQNFYYIQVIVFDLNYLPVAAGGTDWASLLLWKIVRNTMDIFQS